MAFLATLLLLAAVVLWFLEAFLVPARPRVSWGWLGVALAGLAVFLLPKATLLT